MFSFPRHKTFGSKKKKYWFVFKGTVPLNKHFLFFLSFFFKTFLEHPVQPVNNEFFPFADTILSLFKSQEEAFGQAVQKFNLRGNQHGRIYHYGECNVATVLKNYKRTGIHSSISMHILQIPCEIKEENLSNNQDLQLVIISFILLTSCLIWR